MRVFPGLEQKYHSGRLDAPRGGWHLGEGGVVVALRKRGFAGCRGGF